MKTQRDRNGYVKTKGYDDAVTLYNPDSELAKKAERLIPSGYGPDVTESAKSTFMGDLAHAKAAGDRAREQYAKDRRRRRQEGDK